MLVRSTRHCQSPSLRPFLSHMAPWRLCIVLALLAALAGATQGMPSLRRTFEKHSGHSYQMHDNVPVYGNRIGPFHNPSEIYEYYDLPFCRPSELKFKPEGLGEVLGGDRIVGTLYNVTFGVDKERETLCTKTLTAEDLKMFRRAVRQDYYYQMIFDDLPAWGFVGRVQKTIGAPLDVDNIGPSLQDGPEEGRATQHFLFTHVRFEILYNKDRVISVFLAVDHEAASDLSGDEPLEVGFSYGVRWQQTDTPFGRRLEKYSRHMLLPRHLEVHWFAVTNACLTLLLLIASLAGILRRALKKNIREMARQEEPAVQQELEATGERGWKSVHGDVFRFPEHSNLFCAVIGSGTQLLLMVLCIFGLALLGVFFPQNRGRLHVACIVAYALTAGVSTYVSSSLYRQMGGESWIHIVVLTASLFCGPFVLVFGVNNAIAWLAYGSLRALPFGTILAVVLIWLLVALPLAIAGGIAGMKSGSGFDAPCRTSEHPREVPVLPWYRRTVPQMCLAGLIPLAGIWAELYYVFASMWEHKAYNVYAILCIVFIILVLLTAVITSLLTYFQLAAEDHSWWWRSVLCGGSTGLYVFGYCVWYFWGFSEMTGLMQTSFFFGYMACICYALFLMLGAVGFQASLLLVQYIYRGTNSPLEQPLLDM